MVAILACLPPLVLPLWTAATGRLPDRFVAVQLGTNVIALLLVLASFAFDQDSLIDLPLTLVALSLPGTLMYALFIERWL
ncbi:MAG: monovalent cation/H+ antiporter complex subunit F [Rhodopila sp.]